MNEYFKTPDEIHTLVELEKEKSLIINALVSDLSGRHCDGKEYDEIARTINDKNKKNIKTAQQIQIEFRTTVNRLFDTMLEQFPDRIFNILQVMAEEFNIPEHKLIRYLNIENMEKVKDYAKEHYHTHYWEKKEKEAKINKINKKLVKRGLKLKSKTKQEEICDESFED